MNNHLGSKIPKAGAWYRWNLTEYYILHINNKNKNLVFLMLYSTTSTNPKNYIQYSKIKFHNFSLVYKSHPNIVENFQ